MNQTRQLRVDINVECTFCASAKLLILFVFSFPGLSNGLKSESSTSTLSSQRRNDVTHQNVDSQPSKEVNRSKSFQRDAKSEESVNRNKNFQRDAKSDESDIEDEEEERHLRHKLLPEGDDFKIVFISSDSSKESELNSSLEACPEPEAQLEKEATEQQNGEANMDWSGGQRSKAEFAATSR